MLIAAIWTLGTPIVEPVAGAAPIACAEPRVVVARAARAVAVERAAPIPVVVPAGYTAPTVHEAPGSRIETDTTFKVRSGSRLHVTNFAGEIAIASWGKSALRIEARHSRRIHVRVEESGSNVDVSASSRRGIPGRVDFKITAPVWMPLELDGVYTDIAVEGWKNEVSAETVKGDVRLKGGEGFIKLSSVQGAVIVEGARGRLELTSVNEGVSVSDVEGEVSAEAVNGDVVLEGIESRMIEVATVNGDVRFLGGIKDGGRYRFSSHTGDLDLAVPENTSATISVSTFNGEFESTFPVMLSETRKGKRFSFTLGDGSALIDLETFQGTISLRRANGAKEK
jgi:hypothetical protein